MLNAYGMTEMCSATGCHEKASFVTERAIDAWGGLYIYLCDEHAEGINGKDEVDCCYDVTPAEINGKKYCACCDSDLE